MPFVTSERSFGQYVSELATGVNIFNLDHWVRIYHDDQSIRCQSVDSGNTSYSRTPAFHNHLDDCFTVLKNVEQKRCGGKV